MKDSEIREFANRQWHELARLDKAYWAAEYRRNGFITAQKISQALWHHMKSIRKEWPESRERQQDLDSHITLKRLLDRYTDVIPVDQSVQRP